MADLSSSSPLRPRRARRRTLLIAAGALVVLAAVLIMVASWRTRPLLERSMSAALRSPVTIGGLSWNPWTGAFAAAAVAIGSDKDRMTVARLAVTPQLRTVFGDAVVIDRVEIDDPVGMLELDEHYQPILRNVLTGDASSAAAYRVTVREVVVNGGTMTVRYPVRKKTRDAMLKITRFVAKNIALGHAAGSALNMSGEFEGLFDGAPVHAKTDVQLDADPPRVAFDLRVTDLYVSRDVVALPPELDSLTGTIDVRATLEEAAGAERHELRLDVRVDEAQLTGGEGTILSAGVVSLPTMRVDLSEQAVDLGSVTIEDPLLVVALTEKGVVLPITPAQSDAASSWTLASDDILMRGGTLRLRRGEVVTALALQSLRWDGLRPKHGSTLVFDATVQGGGSIAANGVMGVDPPHVALDVRFGAMPLPSLAQIAGVLPLQLARGSADGNVRVEYRSELQRVSGHLLLHDVHTAPADPAQPAEVMAVNAAEMDFTLATDAARVIDVSALTLRYPYVMVRRDRNGVFPYSDLTSGDSTPAAGLVRSHPVRIHRLEVEGGKIEFLDTTLEPPFWASFTDVSAEAAEILHPELTIDAFTVAAKHDELSPTAVTGTVTERGLEAQAELKDVLLETLNAYVSPALGYRVTSGRMTTSATATPAPPLLKSTANLVLRGIDVLQTGRDVIQEESGVPLPIALKLITNLAGEIRLTLPIAVDTQFQTVTFGSVMWPAVRKAIVGALTSPLRLLGSLFGRRGAPHAFAIDPVPFAVGSASLDQAGHDRIAAILRILKAHPGLLLILMPQITAEDLGEVDAAAVASLADQRNAAVRDAFVGAARDPLSPDRIILVPWTPSVAAQATGQPSVYVELQDAG